MATIARCPLYDDVMQHDDDMVRWAAQMDVIIVP